MTFRCVCQVAPAPTPTNVALARGVSLGEIQRRWDLRAWGLRSWVEILAVGVRGCENAVLGTGVGL